VLRPSPVMRCLFNSWLRYVGADADDPRLPGEGQVRGSSEGLVAPLRSTAELQRWPVTRMPLGLAPETHGRARPIGTDQPTVGARSHLRWTGRRLLEMS